MDFAKLATNPDAGSTDWNNRPVVADDLGEFDISPGDKGVVVAAFDCPVGEKVTYQMKSVGEMALDWFQDYGEPP